MEEPRGGGDASRRRGRVPGLVNGQAFGGRGQVVRNQDWDQAFYPEAETGQLRGPDGYGVGRGWRLPGTKGDVFRIRFRRSRPASGADEQSVEWEKLAKGPSEAGE